MPNAQPPPAGLPAVTLDDHPPAAKPGPGSPRGWGMRMLKGLAWATSGKLLGMIATLVVNALLARMLPTEAMGSYFLIVSLVAFAALLARVGLQQTVVRIVAESVAHGQLGRARKALRHVYIIVAIGSIVVGGAMYFGGGAWVALNLFKDPRMAAVPGLMALWVAIYAFTTPVAETFRGLHDMRTTTYLQIVLPPVLLALPLAALWLFKQPVDLKLAVGLSVISALAALGLGTVLLAARMRHLHGPGDIGVGEILRMSGPVFVMNLGNFALANFSLWIAGVMLTAHDVALFGSAMKLLNLVTIPLGLVSAVVQPFIAQMNNERERPWLERLLRGSATLAGLPAMAVLLTFILFGEQVLTLVYGAPYADANLCLVILALGGLVNVWTGSCGQVLVITGHQRQAMNQSLAWGAISSVAAVAAAYFGGILGLSIAMSLGIVMTNLTKMWLAKKLTGLSTHAVLNPSELMDAARTLIERRRRKS